MPMSVQQTKRHTLTALRSSGGGTVRIAAMQLSPSHKPTTRQAELRIDGATEQAIEGSLSEFRATINGSVLCHFGQGEILPILDACLEAAGFSACRSATLDLRRLAEIALERRDLSQARLTIDELAARHGIPRSSAASAETSSRAALTLLAELFEPFFLPELVQTQGSYTQEQASDAFRLAPDDIFVLAEAPSALPDLPDISAPGGSGWRRGPWAADEALDCALRFCRGATLAELARLTGRHPRAIRARLTLDGIVAPLPTP